MTGKGPWQEEFIPDEHEVYVRVHPDLVLPDGTPNIAPIFTNKGNGMSCDWCKYSNPEKTRERGTGDLEAGQEYCVLTLSVDAVRKIGSDEIPQQSVVHDPRWIAPGHRDNNRAHSLVTGAKSKRDNLTRPVINRLHFEFSELITGQLCRSIPQYKRVTANPSAVK